LCRAAHGQITMADPTDIQRLVDDLLREVALDPAKLHADEERYVRNLHG
jgi:hypothetical protein